MKAPNGTVQDAPPQVDAALDGDAASWRDYVDAHPSSSVYHRWEWRRVLAEGLGHRVHYLIARRSGTVCGVLPLAEVRSRLFGHSLSSLPMACDAGALADDEATLARLDEAAGDLAGRLGVAFLEYRALAPIDPQRPSQDLYVMFRREISDSDEENLARIPRKQRAMVRKAIGRGLSASPVDLARFYSVYADNVHRHGTPPFGRAYFAALLHAFGERAELLGVHSPEGETVSVVLSLVHRDEVFPIYAGDLIAARALAANDFKYWELMRRSAQRGVRQFNFGRSKRGSGPYDFKRNWGFEPTPLHYEYLLLGRDSVPQNNPNNPRYRAAIAVWRRLPRCVVNLIGPPLARALG